MADKFHAQVRDFVAKSARLADAILRESVQRTVEQAQEPVGAGGKMPIDTGFLRASFSYSFDGLPFGASVNTFPSGTQVFKGDVNHGTLLSLSVNPILGKSIIWGGWTANYARHIEQRYGFLRSAAQNWSITVTTVVKEVRRRGG